MNSSLITFQTVAENAWSILLFTGPVVAAVIAFALQAQKLRQTRLDRKKLTLEVERLQREIAQRDLVDAKLRLEVERLQRDADNASTRVQLILPSDAAKEIATSIGSRGILHRMVSSGLPSSKKIKHGRAYGKPDEEPS